VSKYYGDFGALVDMDLAVERGEFISLLGPSGCGKTTTLQAIAGLIPVTVAAKLRRSHFLFLGYAPHEWPFRVFLRRVWGGQRVLYRSWAVEPRVEPFGRELWRHLDVDQLDTPLADYVAQLEGRVAPVPA